MRRRLRAKPMTTIAIVNDDVEASKKTLKLCRGQLCPNADTLTEPPQASDRQR